MKFNLPKPKAYSLLKQLFGGGNPFTKLTYNEQVAEAGANSQIDLELARWQYAYILENTAPAAEQSKLLSVLGRLALQANQTGKLEPSLFLACIENLLNIQASEQAAELINKLERIEKLPLNCLEQAVKLLTHPFIKNLKSIHQAKLGYIIGISYLHNKELEQAEKILSPVFKLAMEDPAYSKIIKLSQFTKEQMNVLPLRIKLFFAQHAEALSFFTEQELEVFYTQALLPLAKYRIAYHLSELNKTPQTQQKRLKYLLEVLQNQPCLLKDRLSVEEITNTDSLQLAEQSVKVIGEIGFGELEYAKLCLWLAAKYSKEDVAKSVQYLNQLFQTASGPTLVAANQFPFELIKQANRRVILYYLLHRYLTVGWTKQNLLALLSERDQDMAYIMLYQEHLRSFFSYSELINLGVIAGFAETYEAVEQDFFERAKDRQPVFVEIGKTQSAATNTTK